MTPAQRKAVIAKQVERVARAICPYKIHPCPGDACRVCADLAREAIRAMKTSRP